VDRDLILECAADTLEAHERYSPSLFAEMTAMAAAAGINPAEAVVVGGFTDLVDVVRARVGAAPMEDNCTAVINPAKGYLAQTWDMHASAGEYVIMLKLDPLMGPSVIVQTTAGCLGQMGMNEAGIGVGINNLTSYGKAGVTWPFVVRKALEQTDLDDAVSAVLDADLAGGHNFLVMGPDGVGVNIEAMPNHKRVTRVSEEPYVHTNHCLDPQTSEEEAARLEASVISSDKRLEIGYETADDLEAFFADPWISRRVVDQPHEVATCGAVVIEPGRRKMMSTWGVPGDNAWESFRL
jgi:isopenicillin-N N-acyltransferase-like protein